MTAAGHGFPLTRGESARTWGRKVGERVLRRTTNTELSGNAAAIIDNVPGPLGEGHDAFPLDVNGGSPGTRPLVSVVVPALNEAKNLPHVLPRIPDDVHEVVLVDGGSTDDTVAVAKQLWPTIKVVEQTRRGKGNALACGFEACTGEVIVMLDADGSASPDEIPLFVRALEQGADFAKGSRFLDGGGSADITVLRGVGNKMLSGLTNVLYRTRYTDLCYGYNAFWRRILPKISVDCDGFEVETLINIRAVKAGLIVVEVPSFEEARIYGTSNLRTFRDGFRVLRTILRERFDAPTGRRRVEIEVPAAPPVET
jgi:glycosyltransferase involved in cell wall biosynthesis